MTVKELEKSYSRAHREIINYIMWFATSNSYYQEDGSVRNHGSLYGFFSQGYRKDGPERRAKPGDLIRIGSVIHANEWYLSWYVKETKHWYKNDDGTNDEEHGYESEHLLKSTETGKLCNWSNVGISYFDRKALEENPQWKWNDRQFEFNDRWMGLYEKSRDAYMFPPVCSSFGEGYEVTLRIRERYGGLKDSAYAPSKLFHDYRKVTNKIMKEFHAECVLNAP